MARLALGAVLALADGGCNHVGRLSFAPASVPPAGPGTTAPVTLPDGSGVQLPSVPGSPTTTAPSATGGSATITGTVLGPSGAVAGASVLAERVVGTASASVTAVTGPDGSFSLAGLRGGVYRVRAWEPPAMALATPMVFFLGGTDIHPLTLSLASYTTPGVVGVVNPDPPVAGQPANLAIQVTMPTVGADGVVRQPPLSGAIVTLANGPGWNILSAGNLVTTGSNGEAVFEVSCASPGPQPLDAAVNGQTPVSLQLPGCAPPPPPPTTATTTTTTTTTTSTTTPPTVSPPSIP